MMTGISYLCCISYFFRKVTLIGESERLLGVAERCLPSAELSAVNTLLAYMRLPAICDGQAVKVASHLVREDGQWLTSESK